jgi:AraC-like DNA-binding protein
MLNVECSMLKVESGLYETSSFKTHPPGPLPFEEGKGEFFRSSLAFFLLSSSKNENHPPSRRSPYRQSREVMNTSAFYNHREIMVSFYKKHMTPYHYSDNQYVANKQSLLHYDSCARISMVLWGDLLERTGGTEVEARAFSLVVKPRDVKHANQYGRRGARIFSVLFDSDQLPDFLPKGNTYQWYQWGTQAPILRFMRQMQAPAPDVPELLIELLGSLPESSEQVCRTVPDWLVQIKTEIDDCFTENLRVRELANKAGVHPVHLARVFRQHYGCSVKEYVQYRRLQQALDLLGSSTDPLSQIAYGQGFSDQAHFCRQLKKQLQCTPGQVRALIKDVSFVQDFNN